MFPVIVRSYPKYGELRQRLPEHEVEAIATRTVNIEISTDKRLPEEFFTDLLILVNKHNRGE